MPGQIEIEDLIVAYGDHMVLKNITLTFRPGAVTAIIGPSGCGKTTLLRCLNRLTDATRGCSVTGSIKLDGDDTFRMDPVLLRRRVGMVFQKPNPFPMSIRDNVAYGVKAHNTFQGSLSKLTADSLQRAALYDEVKDRLRASALALSLGQQQRLCIARALAVSPEVLLMDEPSASLDPRSTARLEDSILSLKGEYTVIIVTHDIHQAMRVADDTVFLYDGELIESGPTSQMFEAAKKELTREYLSGTLPLAIDIAATTPTASA